VMMASRTSGRWLNTSTVRVSCATGLLTLGNCSATCSSAPSRLPGGKDDSL
jgi:hypothetical protein